MSENPARPERLEPVLPTFRHSLRPNASTWLSDHLRHRLALFGFVLRVVLHCGQNSRDRLAEHQVAILARPFVRVLDALCHRTLELWRDVAREQLVRAQRLLARGPLVREPEDTAEAAGRLM